MTRSTEIARKYLASRSVAAVFGLYAMLFLAPLIPLIFGIETINNSNPFLFLLRVGSAQAFFVAPAVDSLASFLFGENNDLLFIWLGILASYYITAVVLAIPGRAAYRFGQQKLTG